MFLAFLTLVALLAFLALLALLAGRRRRRSRIPRMVRRTVLHAVSLVVAVVTLDAHAVPRLAVVTRAWVVVTTGGSLLVLSAAIFRSTVYGSDGHGSQDEKSNGDFHDDLRVGFFCC
uniref:(northern house mosquito) hypothetical protein n=1 Tax=Culex pipiens TaxID=7175 RepID=A0A8D8KRQ3_CULPI